MKMVYKNKDVNVFKIDKYFEFIQKHNKTNLPI